MIWIKDVVKRLRSLDTTKNVAEKLRKSFLEIDFDLNNKFGDREHLLGSWDNLPLSNEILTFLGTLFNINPAKLLPKYPKNIHPITLHRCLIVVIVMSNNNKSNSNNCDSLIPNDDEINVLDDDKNVSQTFDIPLKIKSLFQLIYYNIHKGKKKTPLRLMNSSAIFEKCKSRELLTSFNGLGLCTSYKETKLHRNNLAKFDISRSNGTGITLPTHFSKSQFTIAAMDSCTHDAAMTLFQIKPESCCVKPLKSEINLNDIDSISLPCQQRKNVSSKKCITIPDTCKVKSELISEQEKTINSKLDDFSLNVLKISKLFPSENLPTWGALNSLIRIKFFNEFKMLVP